MFSGGDESSQPCTERQYTRNRRTTSPVDSQRIPNYRPEALSHGWSEFERLEAEHGWRYREHLVERGSVWYAVGEHAPVSYPDSIRPAIAEVEESSYWFQHRNRAIARLADQAGITGPVWDIGAGNGAVSAHVQRRGGHVVAVEPEAEGAEVAAQRGVRPVIVGRLEALHLPAASLAAVGVFDVIEHLAEPNALLAEVARVLAPGGILLVTVPAYRWLWSGADVEAGHHRRYTRRSLDTEVSCHGLNRVYSRYLFHSLVPAVLIGRVAPWRLGRDQGPTLERSVAQLRPHHRLIAATAGAVLACERVLDARWPLPFGTTVLAAYERN
jgi:SAM-dependent methyltransferase